jgi:elongation factor P--(R)-beta-lysine ligase
MPWWEPQNHVDRRPLLLARGRIKAEIRAWFAGQDFIEVECGALVASPGNETHLHAFATQRIGTDAQARPAWLHTSPEFAAKKLLAAGETRIFEFARVFRNREEGRLHAPEFTMLEWYRAREDYARVIVDALALLQLAARAAGAKMLRHQGRLCDAFAEAERVTVAQAFARHAGIDLLATLAADGTPDRDRLAQVCGFTPADDEDWSDIFSKILTARVEPKLGDGRVTVIYEYPRPEAALARPAAHDPRVAERFELYACGVELANGCGELTDAREQRLRLEAEMARKARIYGERYPLDEEFLAALAIMPPASGVALGFDRLVMLATGAPHIRDVLWTPPVP